MNTSTGSEPFPSPPPLNLSTQSPSVFDNEEMPPSPPKKIESRAINYRHTDKYENVQPRQIVPVQVQSPFDGIMLGKGNAPSLPLKSSSSPHAEYENVFHPMSTMPARHASSYENYRPVTSEPQKLRSSTVAAKTSPVKPVPCQYITMRLYKTILFVHVSIYHPQNCAQILMTYFQLFIVKSIQKLLDRNSYEFESISQFLRISLCLLFLKDLNISPFIISSQSQFSLNLPRFLLAFMHSFFYNIPECSLTFLLLYLENPLDSIRFCFGRNKI